MSMTDLPRDMLEAILSRVPVKSMRAVRATCKHWNALSYDHSFAKKHFGKTITTKEDEFLVVMLMGDKVSLVSVNLHGIYEDDDNKKFDYDDYYEDQIESDYYEDQIESSIMHKAAKLISLNDDADDLVNNIVTIFHCNGLLLLSCITKNDIKLAVMNPYLGQTRWINPRKPYQVGEQYAIGYEKKRNNSLHTHKILRFNKEFVGNHKINYEFEIYNFDSDTWKVFEDFTPDWYIFYTHLGVSLKGNTYWSAREIYKEGPIEDLPEFLICFDFTTETFGPRLRLPFHYSSGQDTMILSSVREEQLAVLFQGKNTLIMEIWVTTKIDPKEVSWNKLFLAVNMTPLTGFQFNYWAWSFFIDEKKNVVVVIGKDDFITSNLAYIIGNDGFFKQVDLGESVEKYGDTLVCSYVPSSVQIKQAARVMQKPHSDLVEKDYRIMGFGCFEFSLFLCIFVSIYIFSYLCFR